MIRLEASLKTPCFCNLALRLSMPLILKFCFGQGDEFLPLGFLRHLSSRSIKLVVVWTFSLLPGTTVVMARLELQGSSQALYLTGLYSNLLGSSKIGEKHKDKTLVEPILLEGIYCLDQWIWPPRNVSLDLMR